MKAHFWVLTYVLPIINNLHKEFQSESCRSPYLYSDNILSPISFLF